MGNDYKGPIEYSLEMAIEKIGNLLSGDYYFSPRAIAILILQGDEEMRELIKGEGGDVLVQIDDITKEAKKRFSRPVNYELALERQEEIKGIINKAVHHSENGTFIGEQLSRLTMNPITGLPILFLVLYFGIYKFVGGFGAGQVVDFLETNVFENYLNPLAIDLFSRFIPWSVLQDLFIGEYGIITLGLRYAFALILPIVTLFFLVFSLIEDSGYLPRLAMLIDRTFKKIGLSGRAVIPMVLGLGCDTMATLVTRTLPTKRERIISSMLLALAVPCSAQLGVILALLGNSFKGLLIWASTIILVFLFIGWLWAKLLPGERPSFYMEVPPLRLPKIKNVCVKSYVRVKWYFKEILPLFLAASFFIWLGQLTGLFNLIIGILRKPVELIGLPHEAAKIFLFGFFRRDYGAAGLYDLSKDGGLTGVQLVVACVALTLFLPCIAQFLINIKERGWKTGLGIAVFVLFFSFTVAFLVNLTLTSLGVVI